MKDNELLIAEQIARKAHTGQKEESTGDDYIKHVERVVSMVDGDAAKATAWLHDVMEDSQLTFLDLRGDGITEQVVKSLILVTRYPQERYAAYIKRLKRSGDPLAIAVKIADLRDHLRPNCPGRLRKRYEAAWQVLCPDKPLP